MRYWAECGSFFREYWRHAHTTGSVLPSGRFLARALVSELRKPRGPARILEAGPGSGSATRAIARQLRPEDRVDLVEINSQFVAMIERQLDQERVFRDCREQFRIIHAGIEDVPGEGQYDFIISGLPLNNFPGSQVRDIFKAYRRLLKPGGVLSYFEYLLVRRIKAPFCNRRERRRLYRVGRVVGGHIRASQIRKENIFINVPPAIVRHLRLKPAVPDANAESGLAGRVP